MCLYLLQGGDKSSVCSLIRCNDIAFCNCMHRAAKPLFFRNMLLRDLQGFSSRRHISWAVFNEKFPRCSLCIKGNANPRHEDAAATRRCCWDAPHFASSAV